MRIRPFSAIGCVAVFAVTSLTVACDPGVPTPFDIYPNKKGGDTNDTSSTTSSTQRSGGSDNGTPTPDGDAGPAEDPRPDPSQQSDSGTTTKPKPTPSSCTDADLIACFPLDGDINDYSPSKLSTAMTGTINFTQG